MSVTGVTEQQRRNLVDLVLKPLIERCEAEVQREKRERLAEVFGEPATGRH
ncbi:hypothetical protein SEA_LEMOND_90 [Mycobacterium phage LeMond]|uniref:Uncharacterized protein n=1 Tax=Mycobacterium phage KiSi TaxID=2507856 RepID=A0A410TBR3_9CAUD|nr:hypothetical protein I5G98_gp017 [Mycobacterium phage KiSi]AYR01155.1 hypothetical protein SEA_LEMOND_90 [Mycobacterium phage LeMond]AYR01258.1 hypothetical protein SEA_OSCAR_91 [Mycobacterium phage Oscar]QAU06509.1 hypothetical protein SEA_KISI_91 [Mycobacterium phage KiSi]